MTDCLLCFSNIEDFEIEDAIEVLPDGPSEASAYVCKNCVMAEPGLVAHIAKKKSEGHE